MTSMSIKPTTSRRCRRLLLLWLVSSGFVGLAGCNAPTQAKPPTAAPPQQAAPVAPAVNADAWRTNVPHAGADSPWSYPAAAVTVLSNGVPVYVLTRASGPVSLSIVIRHGASDVPPEQSGLASLAAQMIVEATKAKNHYVLSETAESLGSTLTGDANRDFLRLSLDTLAEDTESGIALLAETLLTPAFARDDFLRLQKQHLDDLVSERQNPSRLASLVGLRAVLGERRGAPVAGRLSSVRKLTLDDVRRWHQRYVHANAVALFVVGPVAPSVVQASAERYLGKLRGKRPAPETPTAVSAPEATQVYVVDRPASVQSAVFVAQPYPKRREAGYAARQVLDNVIGGQFTSRINQNLREEHAYTYGARSAAIATRDFGLLTVSTSVETDVTAAAIEEIVKELQALKGPQPARPITAEELDRARTGIVQSLGAHLEDGHRLLLDQEQLFVYDLGPAYHAEYLAAVRSIDGAALLAQTERLTPSRLTIVVVGDAARLLPRLESLDAKPKLAPVEWLD